MQMKRIVLIGFAVIAVAALAASLALWTFFSGWVPVKGKARFIEELEHQAPVTVSIGSMRYDVLRGFALVDVLVRDRATQELWCAISSLQAQAQWLPLVLTGRLAFTGRALIERPCQTVLIFSGRYHLRGKMLAVDAETSEVPLSSVSAPLSRYLPPALTDGALRLKVHVEHKPPSPPIIAGRVLVNGLRWSMPQGSLTGDVTLEGIARPPPSAGGRWSFEARTALHRGALEGLPVAGTISRLEGTARLSPEQVDIETLRGEALGSTWTANGVVSLTPKPSLEIELRSRVDLAPLAAAIPALKDNWQPEGNADLEAVCRSPLSSPSVLDCLVRADVRGTKLSGGQLAQPLTDIVGHVDYDLLTRRLVISQLNGRLNHEPFSCSGEINGANPAQLTLQVAGTLPLEMAKPWLPAAAPIDRLGGDAVVHLKVTGPATAPRYTGQLELVDAMIRLTRPALSIERIAGSVLLTDQRIEIAQAALRLNNQPLMLSAAMTLQNPPGITATVRLPQGQLELAGRLTPKEFVIDAGRVALKASEVGFRGAVSLTEDRPSLLTLSGEIELSELAAIPFVSLPQLEPWRLQGLTTLEAQFRGTFKDLAGAVIRARLRSDHVQVREILLEQFTATVEQSDRLLRIRVPSSFLADGKFWGELTVGHRPRGQEFFLQADLLGLRLDRIATTIPAWRNRPITGNASAHAMVSGTWGTRATWKGEGWVNASGDHLGDVPLLDKLFKGLFGVLAERLGLEMLGRAEIREATAQWRLSQERIGTEDLRLGGLSGPEPVAIYAKGSVGLDRTLDFVIEPELSEGTVLQAPTTSTLASTVLKAAGQLERLRRLIGRHRLTGTLDRPEYHFEVGTREVFKQLAPTSGDLLQSLLEAVTPKSDAASPSR